MCAFLYLYKLETFNSKINIFVWHQLWKLVIELFVKGIWDKRIVAKTTASIFFSLICVGDAFDAFIQKPFCLSGLPWPDRDNPLSAATPRRRRHAAGGEHRSLAITRDLSDQRFSPSRQLFNTIMLKIIGRFFWTNQRTWNKSNSTPFFQNFLRWLILVMQSYIH